MCRWLNIPRSSYYYQKDGIILSRRRIRRIMERLHLVSVYQQAAFKSHSKGKNKAFIPNRLDRQFDQERPLEALVTDLTYVRMDRRWAYVRLIIDLFNRKIIGLSVGWHKTAKLVKQAIQSIPYALTKVKLSHSDRGKEFDNQLIDEMLEAFATSSCFDTSATTAKASVGEIS